MKKYKKIKTLVAIFFASMLMISGSAHAVATINSLDFSLTGSKNLDCEIIGNVELERDPSWTNEEFYVRLIEKYMVETSEGEWATAEEYRNELIDTIRNSSSTWSFFYDAIFQSYANSYIDDYWSRQEYYSTFHEELIDVYYRAYNLTVIGLTPYEIENINTDSAYDVLANYCASTDDDDYITTTFANRGYSGFLKLGDREVVLEDETTENTGSGYAFHEDGFGRLEVKLSRIDDTTIKATYVLKNLTGVSTNFGVAFYTDVELGDNDDAAISKTNRTFTITQDNGWYESTFGAQFNIELDPVPTTSFVGHYTDAKNNRWNNSPRDYYTAADDVDTGLSYSWQGQINAGETKTFSATYTIGVVESFINNFYYLRNEYAEPLETVGAVDGGAIMLPETDNSTVAGWHRDWSSSMDGKGMLFKSGATIIADENRYNYYEVEVPNEILPDIGRGWKNIEEQGVVVTEEMKEKLQELANSVYSDVGVYTYLYEYDDEDIEYVTTEGNIDIEKINNAAGEGYSFKGLFKINEAGKSFMTEEGYWTEEPFEEDELPITIRIKLPEDFIEGKTDIRIVSIKCNDDLDTCDEPEALMTTFNRETGEAFFEINEINEDIAYAITYSETAAPVVPDTGVNTSSISLVETIILLPALLLATLLGLRHLSYRKNQQDS